MNDRNSQDNDGNREPTYLKARHVIRIFRESRSPQLIEAKGKRCVERTCQTCDQTVWLTLEESKQMPPELTQCVDCFRQFLKEGYEALKRNGIILSTVSCDDRPGLAEDGL